MLTPPLLTFMKFQLVLFKSLKGLLSCIFLPPLRCGSSLKASIIEFFHWLFLEQPSGRQSVDLQSPLNFLGCPLFWHYLEEKQSLDPVESLTELHHCSGCIPFNSRNPMHLTQGHSKQWSKHHPYSHGASIIVGETVKKFRSSGSSQCFAESSARLWGRVLEGEGMAGWMWNTLGKRSSQGFSEEEPWVTRKNAMVGAVWWRQCQHAVSQDRKQSELNQKREVWPEG